MPQKDLPHLLHTNAMVLSQLLQEENRRCVLAQGESGRQLRTNELLRLINNQTPPIHVIIDVGAQIIESSNKAVAEQWLAAVTIERAEAAVFFNEYDEAIVVDREGHAEQLLSSPFRGRMHACLVFLDQHHSRGVDIKLPHNYRAAVTLGPQLVKDRLVQGKLLSLFLRGLLLASSEACCRMRELGKGQSVTFFIPPEVRYSFKANHSNPTSFDVIGWALEQTCDHLEKLEPLWAWQGIQYHRCIHIWETLRLEWDTLHDEVRRMQEAESQTLFQLYSPWENSSRSLAKIEEIARDHPDVGDLVAIWKDSSENGAGAALLYEEQERELCQEVQREQQIHRPRDARPFPHEIHQDIREFVQQGRLPWMSLSESVAPAVKYFDNTSVAVFNIPTSVFPNLYISLGFIRSIYRVHQFIDDEFLKPVHWVLSNTQDENLLVISQYEANKLLPIIRESDHTTLHIYAPRTTKEMRSFQHLDFLTVGRDRGDQPISQESTRSLELFSGSLYFESFAEYNRARLFLGLVTDQFSDIPANSVSNEGYVSEETRKAVGWPVPSPFRSNPLPFLSRWISIRTKAHGYRQTHMGTIAEAQPLTEDRFEPDTSVFIS